MCVSVGAYCVKSQAMVGHDGSYMETFLIHTCDSVNGLAVI